MSVHIRTCELKCFTSKLFVTVNNAVHSNTNIGRVHRLTEGLAIARQGNKGKNGAGSSNVIQKLILMTEDIRWANDNRVAELLTNNFFTTCLASRPLGFGVRVCRKSRHMNESLHSGLTRNTSNGLRNVHKGVIVSIVGIGNGTVSSSGRHQVLGLVVFPNQINDQIAVLDRLIDGGFISRAVGHHTHLTVIEHLVQVTHFHFTSTIRNVHKGAALT
mmetsp:Transcript_24733/g.41826  ORF Transcript_24733/g.41826 Transcript_24733/m.41826 type:complete len:217 (+) Transcript_24733:619-1269(+)